MLSITAGGVGIGKTNPAEMLDVQGNTTINGDITLSTGKSIKNGGDTSIRLGFNNNASTWIRGNASGASSIVDFLNSSSTQVAYITGVGNLFISGFLFENSDKRIKTNINTLNSSNSLSNVLILNPVHYNRVEDNKKRVGLIANEVLDVFPELVNKNDYVYHDTSNNINVDVPDCLNMNYTGLIPYLISSIQELNKKIEFLEKNKKDKDQ
jgi:hypothetical protein